MDLYFLRMDTGYDVVMLAVMDEDGTYNVYRVDEQEVDQQPICLFREKDPEKLREHVRKWCDSHLPQEMKMVKIPVNGGLESVEKLKMYLNEKQIPYERRQQTFYVSQRFFDKVKNMLKDLNMGA